MRAVAGVRVAAYVGGTNSVGRWHGDGGGCRQWAVARGWWEAGGTDRVGST